MLKPAFRLFIVLIVKDGLVNGQLIIDNGQLFKNLVYTENNIVFI